MHTESICRAALCNVRVRRERCLFCLHVTEHDDRAQAVGSDVDFAFPWADMCIVDEL